MPIEIGYGNQEETFVVWHFALEWTKEEYFEVYEQSRQLLGQKSYCVDIIADLRRMKKMPENLLDLLRYALRNRSSNRGAMVFISYSSFFKQLCKSAAIDAEASQVYFVETVDEAYQIVTALQAKREYPFALD